MSGRGQTASTTKPTKTKTKKVNPSSNDSQCISEGDSLMENDDRILLNQRLDTMSENIKSIRVELKKIMKKDDIQDLIIKTIEEVTKQIENKLISQIQKQMDEKFQKMDEELKSLRFENEQLKEAMEKSENSTSKKAEATHALIDENARKVNDAIKLGNQNEQYSRKNNFKIMNIPDEADETEQTLVENVNSILETQGVELNRNEIMAIHRLPSKNGNIRPVIVKVINNSVKTRVMKKRKEMKSVGHRLVDDVTRLNTGLINRLANHELIESAWFFNGSVFGKTQGGKRLKFDIFDDIALVVNTNQ